MQSDRSLPTFQNKHSAYIFRIEEYVKQAAKKALKMEAVLPDYMVPHSRNSTLQGKAFVVTEYLCISILKII
jgi:hypothetical protein